MERLMAVQEAVSTYALSQALIAIWKKVLESGDSRNGHYELPSWYGWMMDEICSSVDGDLCLTAYNRKIGRAIDLKIIGNGLYKITGQELLLKIMDIAEDKELKSMSRLLLAAGIRLGIIIRCEEAEEIESEHHPYGC